MPELAEVEFFRRRWSAGHGAKVLAVRLHAGKKLFRLCDTALLERKLTGAKLVGSETKAKQMLFHFSPRGLPRAKSRGWLGIHLGMSGELRVEPPRLPGHEARSSHPRAKGPATRLQRPAHVRRGALR